MNRLQITGIRRCKAKAAAILMLVSLAVHGQTPVDTIPLVRFSADSLEAPIEYSSRDSMLYDFSNQKIILWGGAVVKYTDITLEADYVEFDWNTNTVRATGWPDSTGKIAGNPNFISGDQQFGAKELKYNFKEGKGVIKEASTIQNDLFVLGEQAKFFRSADTTGNDVIYNQNAIFTTCDHPQPHFGVRSRKQKVIPDKLVVVGPSNLEIMGVPTPLWLPFGFFPVSKGKQTGLLFPRDYEYSPNWGYGLRSVGWYFPVNDYLNLQLTSDIYVKGSFRVRAVGDYTKRYKYRGNFTLEYSNLRNESATTGSYFRESGFRFVVAHNQDGKAHPTRTLGGNINIQTNDAQRRNYNDLNSVQTGQLTSNFNYRQSFPGKPFNYAIGLNHSQNTQTRQMTINFPTVNFQTQTLYPFKRKAGAGGPQRWYEQFALTYRGEAKAQVETTDTTLLRPETLEAIQYGARHDATFNASFKLFKYFNFNPSANYEEIWYFETNRKIFDPTVVIEFDTITTPDGELQIIGVDTTFGTVTDTTVWGFKPLRKFTTGASIDTKLFGTVLFSKGPLRGLRHVMTPRVGFSYAPDYSQAPWDYFDSVRVDTRFPDSLISYGIFNTGLYRGEQPSEGSRQMLLTYSLSNFFEAKWFSQRDSTTKNLRIIKRFDLSGNYNFAAPQFKFSPINLTINATALRGYTTILFTAGFDPYDVDAEGRRIPVLIYDSKKRLLRFQDARLSVSSLFTGKDIHKLVSGEKAKTQPGSIWEIAEGFGIRHNLVLEGRPAVEGDTLLISSNSLNLNGSFPITPNWRISIDNIGYDFARKNITYPSLSVSRDLHCWELGFNWQPTRGTYAFFIRVDPGSVFDFINVPYQRGNQDAIFGPGGLDGF